MDTRALAVELVRYSRPSAQTDKGKAYLCHLLDQEVTRLEDEISHDLQAGCRRFGELLAALSLVGGAAFDVLEHNWSGSADRLLNDLENGDS